MRKRHALIPAIALAIAGMAGPAWAGAHAAAPPWKTVPPPHIPAGADGNLLGVSMTGPSNGWAVGFVIANINAPFTPFTAHWDGHRWRAVPVPPAARAHARLNGVAAVSASNAWAVGDSPGGTTAPLILHWDGHHWARARSAPVPGVDISSLLSVAARSPHDVWAVGDAENGTTQNSRTVIEHWNGRRWSLVPSPNLGKFSFLNGVTVAPGGRLWAAGSSDGRTGPFILRWTGRTWVKAKVPSVARNTDVDLNSVTAISARQVWAVGEISVHNTPSQPYSLRWNGHTWHAVKVPDPSPSSSGDRRMLSVTAFGHGQLAAVGSTDGPTGSGPVFSRWNGQRWSVVIGPRNGSDLGAVATDGPRPWAVGAIGTNSFVPFIQVSH